MLCCLDFFVPGFASFQYLHVPLPGESGIISCWSPWFHHISCPGKVPHTIPRPLYFLCTFIIFNFHSQFTKRFAFELLLPVILKADFQLSREVSCFNCCKATSGLKVAAKLWNLGLRSAVAGDAVGPVRLGYYPGQHQKDEGWGAQLTGRPERSSFLESPWLPSWFPTEAEEEEEEE